MLNLFEAIRTNPSYNKLEIGDFLFVEYTCGTDAEKLPNWTDTDYLMHVVTGAKTWHTIDGICKANPGETLFVKKGATIVEQHFEKDVCLLTFFIPDTFVRSTVRELGGKSGVVTSGVEPIKAAARVENDVGLNAFFQSMRSYFSGVEKPSEPLLRLKLKELIVSVLTSGKNPALAAYFQQIGASDAPLVKEIMEANFRYNLSLEEYAKLCHRSLSSFKRDFQTHFQEAPGKWLLRKRLDYSAALLRSSKLNVTEIAFESGFEDVSHFSRVFKEQFGVPPMTYRQAE
ncbi:MAG TPA: AraC family transcriptional regulator [bacterium]|nr:AraC family transcriptional regulator [bacterium]